LIFTAPRPPGELVSQGDLFADALNKIRPGKAVFLSGETDKGIRRQEIVNFEDGKRQYLVGCSLFTEGFNVPAISRVVMARPTKSCVYYTQCIGRGTRALRGTLCPDHDTPEKRHAAISTSTKSSVLVIDFVGNSGRHKLVSAVDIFAGKMSAIVVAKAKKKAELDAAKGLLPRAVQDLLAEAEAEELARARTKAGAEQKRKERTARVKVNSVRMDQKAVNPYGISDPHGQRKRTAQSGRATAHQIEWINARGGHCPQSATADSAGRMIAEIQRRWKDGLCSPRQEKTLRKYGLAEGPVPKDHAKALIDYLAANDWTLRGGLYLERSALGIVRTEAGYRLTIHKQTVGAAFRNPDEVRKVYAGLAVDPAPARA
jgi:type I site-specific restriction endonuclease